MTSSDSQSKANSHEGDADLGSKDAQTTTAERNVEATIPLQGPQLNFSTDVAPSQSQLKANAQEGDAEEL